MGVLLSRLRSLDSFGEPVSLNYKGDSAYKTLPGAFLTLVLKGFIFVMTLLSFFDLIAYRNPNVVQVSLSFLQNCMYERQNESLCSIPFTTRE